MCFLTRQVEECVEDVEAVCVSTLNKFVGVHVSDLRSVQSEIQIQTYRTKHELHCTYSLLSALNVMIHVTVVVGMEEGPNNTDNCFLELRWTTLTAQWTSPP